MAIAAIITVINMDITLIKFHGINPTLLRLMRLCLRFSIMIANKLMIAANIALIAKTLSNISIALMW